MTIAIEVRLVPKTGEERRLEKILLEVGRLTRSERGCIHYYIHRLPSDGGFVVYERYVDREAWEADLESEHFQRLVLREALPLLESHERVELEPLD